MNYNEIKKKQSVSPEILVSTEIQKEQEMTALEKLQEQNRQKELGLENALLKEALAQSLDESTKLKVEFLKLAEKQSEEISKLKAEVKATALKYEKLTNNTEKALQAILGGAFRESVETAKKSAEKIEQEVDKYSHCLMMAGEHAWDKLDSAKYLVLFFLALVTIFSCYVPYRTNELMDELMDVQQESRAVNRVLMGESKFWFDEKNQKLYLNHVERQKQNTSETR